MFEGIFEFQIHIFGKFVLRLYNLSIKCTVNILSLLHVRYKGKISEMKWYYECILSSRKACIYLHFNGCDTNKESVVIFLFKGNIPAQICKIYVLTTQDKINKSLRIYQLC